MKKTNVKTLKMVEALSLNFSTASDEELAGALLVLETLSIKVQRQFSALNTELMKRKEEARQTSLFEDEEFSNAVNSVTLAEETTTVYSVDRAGVLTDLGVSESATKYGNFVETRPVFKEKQFVEAYKAGTLTSQEASHVTTREVTQICMAFGNENKEEK